jgi:hypothetical protein
MSTLAAYAIRDWRAFAVSVVETPAEATDVAARTTCYSVQVERHHRFDALHIRTENGERWVEARRIESSSPCLTVAPSDLPNKGDHLFALFLTCGER